MLTSCWFDKYLTYNNLNWQQLELFENLAFFYIVENTIVSTKFMFSNRIYACKVEFNQPSYILAIRYLVFMWESCKGSV